LGVGSWLRLLKHPARMTMNDLLPADPKAQRTAIIVWAIAAVAGTAAVWWLSSYLDSLTELARTDRAASLALFRSRVLPALMVVVLVSVICGALLLRQGLRIVRSRQFPLDGTRLISPTRRSTGRPAQLIGGALAITGLLMAAAPLIVLSLVLWLLRST
jgi:hypothetical protein